MKTTYVAFGGLRVKQLAKALIRLRICVGWSKPMLVAHTTLSEIPCRGSIIASHKTLLNLFCLIVLILYIPVNNFSVMSGQV